MPNVSVYRPDSLLQEQLGVEEVTHVSHSNLKTDRTDYRERCWKTIKYRADAVECY